MASENPRRQTREATGNHVLAGAGLPITKQLDGGASGQPQLGQQSCWADFIGPSSSLQPNRPAKIPILGFAEHNLQRWNPSNVGQEEDSACLGGDLQSEIESPRHCFAGKLFPRRTQKNPAYINSFRLLCQLPEKPTKTNNDAGLDLYEAGPSNQLEPAPLPMESAHQNPNKTSGPSINGAGLPPLFLVPALTSSRASEINGNKPGLLLHGPDHRTKSSQIFHRSRLTRIWRKASGTPSMEFVKINSSGSGANTGANIFLHHCHISMGLETLSMGRRQKNSCRLLRRWSRPTKRYPPSAPIESDSQTATLSVRSTKNRWSGRNKTQSSRFSFRWGRLVIKARTGSCAHTVGSPNQWMPPSFWRRPTKIRTIRLIHESRCPPFPSAPQNTGEARGRDI